MRNRVRVMTILGTRPEIIRLSEVIRRLDAYTEHIFVHTGQNYDYELSEIFFEELGVRKPDHFLAVDAASPGRAYGNILIETERVIAEESPDAVLVLGDTNSALSAIIAKRLHVPVYHMEAGNRSFDENVPEEVNRRVVDHIADFNLVYTEHARNHLLAEGLHHRRIYLTGSPLREVLERHREEILTSSVLTELGLRPNEFFLASIHREENVDAPDRLRAILACLTAVVAKWDLPLIVSTHPRTRKRLQSLPDCADIDSRISFAQPFGFFAYNHLQVSAKCVISDSGSISEEASILGFPAVTLRDSMERPEAMDAGAIVLTGVDPENLVRCIEFVLEDVQQASVPVGYDIHDTSRRVVALILGTSRLSHLWSGVRRNPQSGI